MPTNWTNQGNKSVHWSTPSDQDLIRMLQTAELCRNDGCMAEYQGVLNVVMQALVAREHIVRYNRHYRSYSLN